MGVWSARERESTREAAGEEKETSFLISIECEPSQTQRRGYRLRSFSQGNPLAAMPRVLGTAARREPSHAGSWYDSDGEFKKGMGRRRSVSEKGLMCQSKSIQRPPQPRPPTKPKKTQQISLRPLVQDRRLARQRRPDLLGRPGGGAHQGAHRTVSRSRRAAKRFRTFRF